MTMLALGKRRDALDLLRIVTLLDPGNTAAERQIALLSTIAKSSRKIASVKKPTMAAKKKKRLKL